MGFFMVRVEFLVLLQILEDVISFKVGVGLQNFKEIDKYGDNLVSGNGGGMGGGLAQGLGKVVQRSLFELRLKEDLGDLSVLGSEEGVQGGRVEGWY